MSSMNVRALDLLFRRMPPEVIYGRIRSNWRDGGLCDEGAFLRYAESCFAGYSKEEKSLLFNALEESSRELETSYGYPHLPLPLSVLIRFCEDTLYEEQDGSVVCRFSELKQWRDGYLLLGQDVPVCAFLAHRDLQGLRTRRDFGWPATIRTDHHGLNRILEGGTADNHRHLKGSTQLFELSWCALMNHPGARSNKLMGLDDFLQPTFSRGPADNVWSAEERLDLAAVVRSALFRALLADRPQGHVRDLVRRDYEEKLDRTAAAAGVADGLRVAYGWPIMGPDGTAVSLDYALTGKVFAACKNSPYRVLAGDRSLLYGCFRAVLDGRFDESDAEYLCLYLVLRTSLRSELVQVNSEVGFYNFMLYQNRKSFFWGGTAYEWEAYRMAVNGPLDTQHVVRLESRVAPEDTPERDLDEIAKVDTSVAFASASEEETRMLLQVGYDPAMDQEARWRPEHFYVVHFIKDDDDHPTGERAPGKGGLCLTCRHEGRRKMVKRQSVTLAEALRESDYLRSRIRGIDACNKELNCRPEVFANAFRYLSDLRMDEGYAGLLQAGGAVRISRTYHAGEDFYSVVDGLRAIDEAIAFLELRQGDRLGHALALGVDSTAHCRCKSNVAVMTKQYNLDNLVWLLFRLSELGANLSSRTLRTQIREEAERAFRDVFGDAVERNGWGHMSLRSYYESMLLRADDPECYRTMRFVPPSPFEDAYRAHALRSSDPRLPALREDLRVAGLYCLYHYDEGVRRRGQRTVRVPTGPEECEVMTLAQEAMLALVEDRGLTVECNPSSNVLIGTFGGYESHPMFRFNHGSLSWHRLERGGAHHLKVCVNTDDLGVFDTSLEFEYALVLRALVDQRDEEGKRFISTADAEGYLRELKGMGMDAVFRGCEGTTNFRYECL